MNRPPSPLTRRLLIATICLLGFCALAQSQITLANTSTPALLKPTLCGPPVGPSLATPPLPGIVSGRVAFYAGLYAPNAQTAKRKVALGNTNQIFPTASMFKTLTAYAAMQAVERGELKLEQSILTTSAKQSIEAYPPGANSLLRLTQRTIKNSDNTANDLLQLEVGPERLTQLTLELSPCTTVLLTTKAWWAAQAGLLSDVLGTDTLKAARAYAALPLSERSQLALKLIESSMNVGAQTLLDELDAYFHGPRYTPELELLIQNTTTPHAFADLLAAIMPAKDLSKTRSTFRQIMTTGCCQPKPSTLKPAYRATKAGSGWRVLTLSGYLELKNGDRIAYVYMNDQSDTWESEIIERQIKPVGLWIERALKPLL